MLTPEQVVDLLPQVRPFRFLDRLDSIDADGAVGEYTFRPDEWFYAGHFPGYPLTPGVILIETMCQTGLVALGIYLLALEGPADSVKQTITLFTDAQVEFAHAVRPGDRVIVRARKVFWRKRKLRSTVELTLADGTLVASGTVSGIGAARG